MCGWQQINLLLNSWQASSVDDDDNQGIHRHDDTPHMVQLGYNLLYRVTAAAVVCGIDYNLLSVVSRSSRCSKIPFCFV